MGFGNYKYLVADTLLEGTNWLSNAGFSIAGEAIYHCYGVYFPIKTASLGVIPNTNKAILTFLQGNKLHELFVHLDNKERPSLVLCNYKNSLFAWEHQEYHDTVKKGNKSLKIKHQKGFRKGKQITSLEFSSFAKENKIKRYDVERFDKERLFERGAEGLNVNQQYKINLLGCGSIGSFLLNTLVQVGFNNFNIIDNEYFEAENLTRHICDMDDLKNIIFKVEALKKKMYKKYPLLHIDTFTDNIILLAKNDLSLFNNTNLNILCVGEYNVELLFAKLLEQNKLTSPLLIIWVEPYLIAGHFVYMTPNNNFSYEGQFNIEDNFLKYKHSINSEISNSFKQEAGCQSVYVPYGTLNISSFVNNITFLIQEISNGNIYEGCIYRWSKGKNILESKMEKLQ